MQDQKPDANTIEAKFQEQNSRATLGKGLRIACPILLILIILSFRFDDILNGMWLIKLVAIVLCLVGSFVGKKMRQKALLAMKDTVAAPVTGTLLNEVLDNAVYEPNKHLPVEMLRIDMGIPMGYNTVYGSDYVQGTYQGIPLQFSDIKMTSRYTVHEEGGGTHEAEETRFQGLWVIFRFNKQMSADVIVSERAKLLAKLKKADVKMENDAFNKKFCVRTENPEEAFYVLTPHMMEYLMELDEHAHGDTYIHFQKDGTVQLAINTGKDFFEPNLKFSSVEQYNEHFRQQLRYITGLIDAMRLIEPRE